MEKTKQEEQFTLPEGYKAWCHDCGRPPFNKFTEIQVEGNEPQELADIGLEVRSKTIKIMGLGFKTIAEHQKHVRDLHRQYKG